MKKFLYFLIFLILLSSIFFIFSQTKKEPIKIGLMVTLTGIYLDLGREIRDGALLAMEMINEKGGVNGKPLKLIIKDNKYNIELAEKNYEELYKENVVAVIGPATSTMAKNLLPIINEKKLLSISPTATSTELAGLDDYMIRIRPTNKDEAEVLADYIKKNLKIKRIAIIYDEINIVYTKDFIDNFKPHFKKDISFLTYSFHREQDIRSLSRKVINQSPDAVLLILDVYDASLFIQNLKVLKPDILILTATWAKTPKLIEYAGKWSEGILTTDIIDDTTEGELNYVNKRFIEKFGKTMNFPAINGFDSVMIIKKALENGATRDNLKETILRIKRFEGIQGEIVFNEFGDRQVKPFILKVKKGKYERVKQ